MKTMSYVLNVISCVTLCVIVIMAGVGIFKTITYIFGKLQ